MTSFLCQSQRLLTDSSHVTAKRMRIKRSHYSYSYFVEIQRVTLFFGLSRV